MKKLLFGLILVLLLCGPASAQRLVVGFITGTAGLGDLSFNDMAYGGIRIAQKEYGFHLIVKTLQEGIPAGKAEFLDVAESSDIVILLGAQHVEMVKANASKFSHKQFILIESPVEGLPNVSSVSFKQNEGSFLAGYLAGRMTRTDKVGFVGGVSIPPVRAFEGGFTEGVRYANPRASVVVEYVSQPGDFSGFDNPAKGFELAQAQYRSGADIIFAVAGLTGNGVIEAARRAGKFAIGVDSDQDSLAKGRVLTSMIKRLDVAAYKELVKALTGQFKGGDTQYGLADGGVGLTEMRYTRELIPPQVLSDLDRVTEDVSSGRIVVPDWSAP